MSFFAILQDHIGIEGRAKVLAHTVRVAVRRRYRVTIITFTSPATVAESLAYFVPRMDRTQVNITQLPGAVIARRIGYTYASVLCNLLAWWYIRRADVVWNNNNFYVLSSHPVIIDYIHTPAYSEFAKKDKEWWRVLLHTPLIVLSKCLAPLYVRIMRRNVIIANSRFSARAFRARFPSLPEPRVIYPPTVAHEAIEDPAALHENDVVSVGSIHPVKRQHDQRELARLLPELRFTCIGHVRHARYFDELRSGHPANMRFIVDDHTSEEPMEALRQARFFLHTKPLESFGISIVEGLAAGCIPVVPNMGGQREVVPDATLRFDTLADAHMILARLSRLPPQERNELVRELQHHIRRHYTTDAYDVAVSDLFEEVENMVRDKER